MSNFKASPPIEQLQGKLFGQHSNFSARLQLNAIFNRKSHFFVAMISGQNRKKYKFICIYEKKIVPLQREMNNQ